MTPENSIADTRPRRCLRGRCYTIALQSPPLESPSPPSVCSADSSPGRGAMLVQVSLVCFPQWGKRRAARADRGCLPLEGKGDRLRWMRWMYLPLISLLRRQLLPREKPFLLSLSHHRGGACSSRAIGIAIMENKKPPSDEGGGMTAGFDGGREKRPIVESPNFPPPQSAIWPTAPPVGEPC